MHCIETLIFLNEHPELARSGASCDISLGFAKSRPKAKKAKPAPVVIAPSVDFEVENHGTIYLFRPLTEQARQWVASSIDPDAQRWCDAIVVEHRYIADIVAGAQADGLAVA